MHSCNSEKRTGRNGWSIAAALLCLVALTPSLKAQVSRYGDKEEGPANTQPSVLSRVGIAQHLDQQLPLNLTFTDDTGKQVELGSYFGKKPAILALVYYQCPMLCSEELNGLVGALEMRAPIWPPPRSAATSSATAIPRRPMAGTS